MVDWTKSAELDPGRTLHGHGKTLGKSIAEAAKSSRESIARLGDDDIYKTKLYSREAEQQSLAEFAIQKFVKLFG